MNKKEWAFTLLAFLAILILDQVTKISALGLKEQMDFSLLHFKLNLNQGIILGYFSDLPNLLRVVSLSTGGAFLIFFYLIFQYIITMPALLLRSGMTLLIAGVLGNVIDRIRWGFVVDFLIVGRAPYQTAIFNLADLSQLIGFALIVYGLFKAGDHLWPEKNDRKTFWVNKKFQLKYCLILSAAGACLSLISLTFCYTYLRIVLSELPPMKGLAVDQVLKSFITIYAFISVFFCFCLFLFGKFVSHRIAGPLYAFERFLDDLLDGKHSELQLRTGDEFKHLEEVSVKLQDKLENLIQN